MGEQVYFNQDQIRIVTNLTEEAIPYTDGQSLQTYKSIVNKLKNADANGDDIYLTDDEGDTIHDILGHSFSALSEKDEQEGKDLLDKIEGTTYD